MMSSGSFSASTPEKEQIIYQGAMMKQPVIKLHRIGMCVFSCLFDLILTPTESTCTDSEMLSVVCARVRACVKDRDREEDREGAEECSAMLAD